MHTTDLGGGARVGFDGYRLVLSAPMAMQHIALDPEQWRLLVAAVEERGDGLFPVEPKRIKRRFVCDDCGIEEEDDEEPYDPDTDEDDY